MIYTIIHTALSLLLAYKIMQLFAITAKIQARERMLDNQIDRLLNKISDLEAREASLEKKEYNYEVSTNKELRELRNDIKNISNIVNKIKI